VFVRGFDIAIAALALRAAPPRPAKPEKRLVPAVDDPNAATLDRSRIDQSRAALIASLWPDPYRQCVVRPLYLNLEAPAAFGVIHIIGRAPAASSVGARALLLRLQAAFAGASASAGQEGVSRAA
jgi:hypothetical protein